MAANKKCVMNVFLMDKTTQLFVVQLYLCIYKFIFSETIYEFGTKWLFRIFLTYI